MTASGPKSSRFLNVSSTPVVPPSLLSLFSTDSWSRGEIDASTSLKLSRSISTNFRSFIGGGAVVCLPLRSARIPTTNGSSFFWMAPPVSTSYVICTRGGRTRSSLCCRLSGISTLLLLLRGPYPTPGGRAPQRRVAGHPDSPLGVRPPSINDSNDDHAPIYPNT